MTKTSTTLTSVTLAPQTIRPCATFDENEYAAARARAAKKGIEICGHGTRKADGAPVVATTSASDPIRLHLVVIVGGRLHCDCKSRVYCTHRLVVHDDLTLKAHERDAAREAERAERAARERARATAPLHRDNAPISMFRS